MAFRIRVEGADVERVSTNDGFGDQSSRIFDYTGTLSRTRQHHLLAAGFALVHRDAHQHTARRVGFSRAAASEMRACGPGPTLPPLDRPRRDGQRSPIFSDRVRPAAVESLTSPITRTRRDEPALYAGTLVYSSTLLMK